MRKITFFYHVGYAGMDGIEVIEFPDDVTTTELEDIAWEGAVDNAERFGYYPASFLDYAEEEVDEETTYQYTESIEGSYEEYDPEKHDQLKPGGGKWFE